MEIEIQRDNRVCLEDYEWRKWIVKKMWLLNAKRRIEVFVSRVVGFVMDKFAFTVKKSAGITLMTILRSFSIIVISLSTLIHTAQASGFVAMTTGYRPNSNIYAPISPTPDAACKVFSSRTYAVLNNPTTWACYADLGYWLAWLDPVSVCPANSAGTTTCTCNKDFQPDSTATSCVPVAVQCPANSTRSNLYPFLCDCHTGYKFDAVGGICVPLRECTIPDLPPITDPEVQLFEDSPNLADTARLTTRMQTALTCLKTAAAAGSPSVGSAYRPTAYNQHLIDVWKKWREFRTDENYDQQDCAARKEKIRLHFKTHGLKEKQPPVPNSDHTRGEAVDVTIDLPPANIDALAPTCRLYRPPSLRITDPVHFIYR